MKPSAVSCREPSLSRDPLFSLAELLVLIGCAQTSILQGTPHHVLRKYNITASSTKATGQKQFIISLNSHRAMSLSQEREETVSGAAAWTTKNDRPWNVLLSTTPANCHHLTILLGVQTLDLILKALDVIVGLLQGRGVPLGVVVPTSNTIDFFIQLSMRDGQLIAELALLSQGIDAVQQLESARFAPPMLAVALLAEVAPFPATTAVLECVVETHIDVAASKRQLSSRSLFFGPGPTWYSTQQLPGYRGSERRLSPI